MLKHGVKDLVHEGVGGSGLKLGGVVRVSDTSTLGMSLGMCDNRKTCVKHETLEHENEIGKRKGSYRRVSGLEFKSGDSW